MWAKVRKIASLRNIFITVLCLVVFSFLYVFLEWETTMRRQWKTEERVVFPSPPPCRNSGRVSQN